MSGVWTVAVEEQLRALTAKVADLEFKHKGMEQWHNELQARVAAMESTRNKAAFNEHELKGQAAQVQATNHLYAPLRSDTRPLLEMSVFIRKLANLNTLDLSDEATAYILVTLRDEAAELVKRNT
jgi:hypothetical protein